MKMKTTDLDVNLTDATARDYAKELIEQLVILYEGTDTCAMATNAQSYLQGKKDAIGEIVTYIRRTI